MRTTDIHFLLLVMSQVTVDSNNYMMMMMNC